MTLARQRAARIAVGGLGLLVCTNGPSLYAALHWFDGGVSWQFWTFAYPFGAVAIIGTVLLWRHAAGRALRTLPWPLVAIAAYVGWTLLSGIWSVSPYSTPSLAVTGVGIAAFGCWFGWCLHLDEQIWSVVLATATASITSALAVAYRPEFGKMPILVDDLGGEWRGIFGNRNSLAPVCVLGLLGLVGLVAARPSMRRVAAAAPLAVLYVVMLRGSESETSIVALALMALMAAALPLLWLARRGGVPGRLVGAVAVAGVAGTWVLIFANFERVASWAGRDPTLSRRRLIWADVREFISVHPVRGYGYWAFWDRGDLTAATYAHVGSPYGSAHNSVLEVLLGLGAVGLVFYVAICAASIGGVFAWTWRDRSVASAWWSVLVVFLVAENLTESFVLWHSYIWVLFVAAALVPFGKAARADRRPPIISQEQAVAV